MGKVEYKDLFSDNLDDQIKELNKELLELEKIVKDLANVFKAPKAAIDALVVSLDKATASTAAGKKAIKENSAAVTELATRQMEAKKAADLWQKAILESANAAKIAELNEKRLTTAIKAQDVTTKAGAKAISLYKKELDKNTAAVKTATEVSKKQSAALKSELGSYNQIQKALKKNVADYKKMSAAERETTKAGKQLTAQIKQQESQLKKMDAAMGRNFRNVGNYSSALRGARGSLLGVAAGMGITASATLLVGQALAKAGKLVVDFQSKNAILAGILNTSVEEMSDLTDEAIRLGSITAKTATEILELQTALARLGFKQSEIIDLTEGIINGSIALNAELDETGSLVGALVRTFDELGTGDTVEIMDKLTVATQNSALNFERLQTSLPIVSGAANAAGISFNQMISLLAILASSGLDASMSATSLRNIFIDSAAKGLDYTEILEKVKGSTNKLTTANDEFGRRTAVSATILAEQIDNIGEFELALESAGGASKEFAEKRLDTLEGSLKLLNSAWEGLILTIDKGDGPLSRAFKTIVDLITKGVTAVAKSNESAFAIGKRLGTELAQNRATLSATLFSYEERLKSLLETQKELRAEEKLSGAAGEAQSLRLLQVGADVDRAAGALHSLQLAQTAMNEEWDEGALASDLFAEQIATLTEKELKALQKELKASAKAAEDLAKAFEKEDEQPFQEPDLSTDAAFDKYEKSLKLDEDFKILQAELQEQDDKDALDRIKKRNEKEDKLAREKLERNIGYAQAAFDAIGSISDSLFERQLDNLDNEIDALELQRDIKISNAKDDAVQIEAINKEFDEKQKILRTEKAKKEKQAAIIQANINIAQSILGIFGAYVPPVSYILAGIAAAAGAVQLATIASQPIPEFAEGTDFAQGGASIVGEEGTEAILSPSGKLSLTPSKATVMDLDRGSKVFTAQETKDALRAFNDGARELAAPMIISTGLTRADLDKQTKELAQAFENQSQYITQIGSRGLESFMKYRGNKTKYYNERYN